VRIGRSKQNDVVLPLAGISWFHAELTLLSVGRSAHGPGGPVLCVVDVSSNHTGLRPPGGSVELIPKGVPLPVQDGSLFVLPMRVKAHDTTPSKRMCFRVDFERPPLPEPAAPPQRSHQRVDVKVLAMCASGANALDFRMRPDSKFGRMMEAWCRHHNMPGEEARFCLGSRELRPEDTPLEVGWTPGRGALIVEATPRRPAAEDDAKSMSDHSPAVAPSMPFLKSGWTGEEDASPDLLAYAEDTQATTSARAEHARAAKLLRDALHDPDAEESDHLSGPSPDSSMED